MSSFPPLSSPPLVGAPLESLHPLVLYTKQSCSACTLAKQTLAFTPSPSPPVLLPNGLYRVEGRSTLFEGLEVCVIDLKVDERERDRIEFERLVKITSRRTVPQIFLSGTWIGGGDDIQRLGLDGTLLTKMLIEGVIDKERGKGYIEEYGSVRVPPMFNGEKEGKDGNATVPKKDIPYGEVLKEIEGLIETEKDLIANASNVSSAVYNAIIKYRGATGCNWVGFYFSRKCGEEVILVLGPFMGKPACRRIRFSEGVCGKAARTNEVQLVKDVHDFPGHIACDSASNSEVVIPLLSEKGEVLGVFDLDCPVLEGYSEEDASFLQSVARMLVEGSDWSLLAEKEVEASEVVH
ncbi:hypothetical protein TrST_g10957 [Triparma strigata]|uniref:GAF domain-containing protein n=1 Tax=Triparma strigata TaxID=1606541 RepID=A0A9W7EYK0_9STRA|nr:hypothetical protein TrST_g10957 [Triparma strigata]